MKVVINKRYGGFRLSDKALDFMGITDEDERFDFEGGCGCKVRTDPRLIKAIETLGEEAWNSSVSYLKVVEIPDDVEWTISEYDGVEWVDEVHRSWY